MQQTACVSVLHELRDPIFERIGSSGTIAIQPCEASKKEVRCHATIRPGPDSAFSASVLADYEILTPEFVLLELTAVAVQDMLMSDTLG